MSERLCIICNQSVVAAGRNFISRYCSDPCIQKGRSLSYSQKCDLRFWQKVDKSRGFGPKEDCWRWTGRVEGRGYGEFKIKGRYYKAHRVALFGFDDLANPLFACHRCDNPRCVNPSHLFPGESVDNVRDMHAKGRAPSKRNRRYLTREQVREIRCSGISGALGAIKYGVSRRTIAGILKGGGRYRD